MEKMVYGPFRTRRRTCYHGVRAALRVGGSRPQFSLREASQTYRLLNLYSPPR